MVIHHRRRAKGLSGTTAVATYPPERQPFRDMIDGFPVSMRMRDETPVRMLLDVHRKRRPEVVTLTGIRRR